MLMLLFPQHRLEFVGFLDMYSLELKKKKKKKRNFKYFISRRTQACISR